MEIPLLAETESRAESGLRHSAETKWFTESGAGHSAENDAENE